MSIETKEQITEISPIDKMIDVLNIKNLHKNKFNDIQKWISKTFRKTYELEYLSQDSEFVIYDITNVPNCVLIVGYSGLYVMNSKGRILDFENFYNTNFYTTNLDKLINRKYTICFNYSLEEFSESNYNVRFSRLGNIYVFRENFILEFGKIKSFDYTTIFRNKEYIKKYARFDNNTLTSHVLLSGVFKVTLGLNDKINDISNKSLEEIKSKLSFNGIRETAFSLLTGIVNDPIMGENRVYRYTDDFASLVKIVIGDSPKISEINVLERELANKRNKCSITLKTDVKIDLERLITMISQNNYYNSNLKLKDVCKLIEYLNLCLDIPPSERIGDEFHIFNQYELLKYKKIFDDCISQVCLIVNQKEEKQKEFEREEQRKKDQHKKQLELFNLLDNVSNNSNLVKVFGEIRSLTQEEFVIKHSKLNSSLAELAEYLYSWNYYDRCMVLRVYGI